MRIISDFRDYYDSAQGYGIDPDLIYNRKTEEVEVHYNDLPLNLTHFPKDIWGSYPNEKTRNRLTAYYLFFCGTVYTSLDLSFGLTGESTPVFSNKWEDIRATYENGIPRNPFWGIDGKLKDLQDFHGRPAPDKAFEFLKCPVFLWKGEVYSRSRKINIVKNPSLVKLGFQHVVDSYSAFQTISTYLGNELCEREKPHTPTNEDLIRARGFDLKVSFRSGKPGSKKVRRRKNKSRKRNSST